MQDTTAGMETVRSMAQTNREETFNFQARLAPPDPNPSVEFLRSGPTLSYDIFVFRFYEGAVRDLRQSAMTGLSPALYSCHSRGYSGIGLFDACPSRDAG